MLKTISILALALLGVFSVFSLSSSAEAAPVSATWENNPPASWYSLTKPCSPPHAGLETTRKKIRLKRGIIAQKQRELARDRSKLSAAQIAQREAVIANMQAQAETLYQNWRNNMTSWWRQNNPV